MTRTKENREPVSFIVEEERSADVELFLYGKPDLPQSTTSDNYQKHSSPDLLHTINMGVKTRLLFLLTF